MLIACHCVTDFLKHHYNTLLSKCQYFSENKFKSKRSGKRCNGELAMLFIPKNTKSPPKSSTFVLGCKIVAPLWAHSTKMQLNKSRQRRVYHQFRRNCISSKRTFCISSLRKLNTAYGWWYTPSVMRYTLSVMIYQACGLDKKIPSR